MEFQFKKGDFVYSTSGRGVVLEAFSIKDDKRYLVRSIKIVDFIEPVEEDIVYSEQELTPVGDCDTCIPLTEDFIEPEMSDFKQYRRKLIAELRPFVEGEVLDSKVSISQADRKNGSPKVGDMIARNPKNHDDQWLVAKQYFEDNFEAM